MIELRSKRPKGSKGRLLPFSLGLFLWSKMRLKISQSPLVMIKGEDNQTLNGKSFLDRVICRFGLRGGGTSALTSCKSISLILKGEY